MSAPPAGAVPPLTARRPPWLDDVLAEPDRLADLVERHGSPVHLLCADPLVANHAALRAVVDDHGLDALVLFARKANRARSLVAAAHAAGAGIDTASLRELDESVALGVPGDRLVVTAAVKPPALLRRAVAVGATVVVDNADEAVALRDVAVRSGRRPVVALRVSGFTHRGTTPYSRFGVDLADAPRFVAEQLGDDLRPTGLHFHLDGYSREQRGAALHQCLDLAEQLAADGVAIGSIDIGGGLRVSYLDDAEQWDAFWRELRRALRGEREALTFGGDGLGLAVVDGLVTGTPAVYPFHEPRPGAAFLDDVLTTADADGRTAAGRLRASGTQLRLEPGRALLDGVGATVARVAHRKRDRDGALLVGLEMHGTQHGSSSADILLDPLLVPGLRHAGGASTDHATPTSAYLTGSYCTEGDVLLRRRVPLPRVPAVGDLVVFVNTAGYFMHFRATDGHRTGPAQDLVVTPRADGGFHVRTDEEVEALAVSAARAAAGPAAG